MLIAPLTLRTRLDSAHGAPVPLPALLAHYQAALERFDASVERINEEELRFTVGISRPARLRFSEADLGLIAGGTIAFEPTATGCTVELRARPRTWFLLLALTPWALFIWALGWTTAPWRYAFAYGGIPLFALLWILVWANLAAFLDDTNRSFPATPATGRL